MTWRDLAWWMSTRQRVHRITYRFLPPFTAWDAGPDLDLATWEWPDGS